MLTITQDRLNELHAAVVASTYTDNRRKATREQLTQPVMLSNYDVLTGMTLVHTKNPNGKPAGYNNLFLLSAFELPMYENVYTIDGRLIGNRIK